MNSRGQQLVFIATYHFIFNREIFIVPFQNEVSDVKVLYVIMKRINVKCVSTDAMCIR